MKDTPTVEELNKPEKFELFASVEHGNIRDFVIEQVLTDRRIIPFYTVYQTVMVFAGLFFFARAVVLAFRGDWRYLVVSLAAILFSFTVMVLVHELLHAISLLLTGARRITFGANLKKFVFFAEADRYVMGKKSFLFVALTPLVVIQVISVAGIVVWFSSPLVYFFLILMSLHSFFCSGDIALVSLFYRHAGRKTFTYDDCRQKKSFYFISLE